MKRWQKIPHCPTDKSIPFSQKLSICPTVRTYFSHSVCILLAYRPSCLQKRGFVNGHLTGLDISTQMLQKANQRDSYESLDRVDLLHKLPFSDKVFDYLICVGTTTYLLPSVLKDWIRVVKAGGYIAFTHKTNVWSKWEGHQKSLEEGQMWKHVWTSQDLFYLPSCSGEEPSTRVRVYVYQT